MSIVGMKIVLPDDATLLSGRTRPCPQWWRANQAQCQPLIYTDYIQESIRYKFCSLRRAKPANNLFNQTSAPLSTLLLTFCLTQNSRNTQNYLSLSRWFTLALDSTEWHSFHCACLARCQLMCFVFIRFHRASRRDEVCDKFCVFNFFCSLVFYSLLINQFCVFREFRVKQILLSHRLYPYFGNAPP